MSVTSCSDIIIRYYDSVKSTNDTAKDIIENGELRDDKTTVVIARGQTAGKGRLGRKFYSSAGNGVYMSVIFKPRFDIRHIGLLTTAASVAVARAIKSESDLEPEIKWVNDIYINNRKVGGILVEALSNHKNGAIRYIILGIGINTGNIAFPDELNHTATSLYHENSNLKFKSVKLLNEALVKTILGELLPMLEDLNADNFLDYYRQHSMLTGKPVTVYKNGYPNEEEPDPGGIPAIAKDITDEGGLVVEYENGMQEILSSGEVTIRRRK